jgi:benzoyl-CoA reductase/2-hydroxyglutaryl-CoA dehydratase subunit BcrC/BadD/HgdB
MVDLEFYLEYYEFLKQEKENGKKIIAFLSHDNIPDELIDAAGFFPLRLIFSGNDELMDKGAEYLPTSTCSFALSNIGLFAETPNKYKFLELIDYFIVSNHCVSDICSSEIICKYFNIPRINFYVPYILSETGLKYYRLELIEFKNKLEEIKGSPISNEDIFNSILKFNDFRKKISKIKYIKISGSKKLELYQKASLYGPKISEIMDFDADNLAQAQKNNNKKNVILTGCSIFLGDDLIDLIEEGGGNVVFLDTWVGDAYFSQQFDDEWLKDQKGKDPIDILKEIFEKNSNTDHVVPNYINFKISKINSVIKDLKKNLGINKIGVINHIIKFCDHMSLPKEQLKEELQAIDTPVLNLERDYSRASHGQLSTRIEAFLEMI